MSRRTLQPSEMLPGAAAAMGQVVCSKGTHVHISGQTAVDKTGAVVGDDLASQIDTTLENVRIALAEVGATPSNLVRFTTYIVDYQPDQIAAYMTAMHSFFDPENLPACALIGVSALAQPELLVEIEATAVIDE